MTNVMAKLRAGLQFRTVLQCLVPWLGILLCLYLTYSFPFFLFLTYANKYVLMHFSMM